METLEKALQHHQAGRLAEAEMLYRQILDAKPDHPDVLHLLGVIALQTRRYEVAVNCLDKAVACKPHEADYHYNLGLAFIGQGKTKEAVQHFQHAIVLKPDFTEAHNSLGNALMEQGRLEEAGEHYRRALQLDPNHAGAHNNLGAMSMRIGQTDRAVTHYRRAIALEPQDAEVHYNLANALKDLNNVDEAVNEYKKAIAIRPDFTDAYVNLGLLLKGAGELSAAVDLYQKALAIEQGGADILVHLSAVRREQALLDEALKLAREAFDIKPDSAMTLSNLLFTMQYMPGLDTTAHLSEARGWYARHPQRRRQSYRNDPDPNRALRVGYVSPDFRTHSVAFFIEPVLAAHDRARFDVFCYANVTHPDGLTKRLKRLVAHWRDVVLLSDEDVVSLINQDGIDILVDLAGHTAGNRLSVFAHKPAPVQVTYLGYPNTTGLATIDYRLTDALTDPPGQTDRFHTEGLVRLPEGFLCYQPPVDTLEAGPLTTSGAAQIIFGSFNNAAKINDDVVAVWSRILKAIPEARLVLKARALGNQESRARFTKVFATHGVSPERLEMISWVPSSNAHLRLYHRIDIALDTFPYAGTTTTCEALWMGVPVITLAGKAHAGRVGVSLLSHAGLPDLIAESPEAYVDLAVRLASDQEELADLRRSLREKMRISPLTDARRFTGTLEAAYRKMWEKWCESVTSSTAGA